MEEGVGSKLDLSCRLEMIDNDCTINGGHVGLGSWKS